MIYNIRIDDSNSKAKALLDFLRTLDFVKLEKDEDLEFPSMSDEEISRQALLADEDIKNGNYVTQDQLMKDARKW